MRVPQRYYDRIFHFKGQWDIPSCCGIRILRHEKPIVIVTELYQDNPGTSVTAAGMSLAEQICREEGLDIYGIKYLQCNPETGSKLSFYEEEIFDVDFASGTAPAYRRLSVQEIKNLSIFPNGNE